MFAKPQTNARPQHKLRPFRTCGHGLSSLNAVNGYNNLIMLMRIQPPIIKNLLLDALSQEIHQHFLADCDEVKLVFGSVLSEPGEAIAFVYFPTSSFISLLMPIDDKSSLEVGLIGNEGMVGIPLLLGVETSSLRSLVQGGGSSLRMPASLFLSQLKNSPTLRQRLNLYTYVTMKQLAQTSACNRFHLVEERLARWLLMTRDRAHSDRFHITHEFLAQMLGVRRVGVTKAAGSLQQKKLISYSRGNVCIHNIAGLEASSCSCYRTARNAYEGIMNTQV